MYTRAMQYCIVLCAIAAAAHAACVTFEPGLCAGSSDCQCTFGTICGSKASTQSANTTEWVATKKRELEAQGMVASCATMGGTCYTVLHGQCPGAISCLAYGATCGGSTPPPPPPAGSGSGSTGSTSPPAGSVSGSTTAPPPPPPPSTGFFGLDIALWVNPTAAQWTCMKSNYQFAVIEVWNGGTGLRSNIATAVANARAAGFDDVDVYAFMCPNCNNPAAASVQKVAAALQGVNIGRLWIDVEQCTNCWSTNLASNAAYVQSLVDAYKAAGIPIGIYTSPGEWPMTVGSSAGFTDLPLWYANYDAGLNFNDWKSGFGGWQAPVMKQFADSASNTCGVSVDRNWRPTAKI